MNKTIRVKLSRDGEEMQTDRLRVNINGTRYTMNIESDGKLRINKYDDNESMNDVISINPSSGSVIDIY